VSALRLRGFSKEFCSIWSLEVVLLLSEDLAEDLTFALKFRYTLGHPRPCNVIKK
jgi:hypothetical protein